MCGWSKKGERVEGLEGYDEGPMLLGSQPKSRTRLMGSPLLCDPSLENWSRHPDSCLPQSLPTAMGLGMWMVVVVVEG